MLSDRDADDIAMFFHQVLETLKNSTIVLS